MSDGLPQPPSLDGQNQRPAIPIFFVEAVQNTFRSEQEGRPHYDDIEMLKLLIPGDKNSSPVKRVDHEDRERYPKQYAAFKAGIEAPTEGTPLAEWPPIQKSQVLEFAHFNIKTVEHLAQIHDGQLQNLPMGSRALREQAKAYLDIAANGTGPIAKMVSQIEDLKTEGELKDSIIADMGKRLAALEGKTNASDHS
jgi:hypothetical protein